jgi:hypothetical protein
MSLCLLTVSGAGIFLLILVILHFLKPELDPSWRMISEYEIGRCGWLMRIAFACLSVGCIALVMSLWRRVPMVAEVLLTLGAIGPLGAAIFATDPITTPRNSMTLASRLHAVFGALFILGFPIAITIIGWNATDPLLAPLHSRLPWMSIAVWVGFFTFLGSSVLFGGAKGTYGPDVRIGWPNWFMMFTYLVWLTIIALAIG